MTPHSVPTLQVHHVGRRAYGPALALQRALHRAVVTGATGDTLILVEHEPVVTLGRRGNRSGIFSEAALTRAGIDVVPADRGGDVTYHGPGQLVAYPILDLRRLGASVRCYIEGIEAAVLRLLEGYGVPASRDYEQRGVFTAKGKIASVGVRVSHWVTMHGVAINVDPDMSHWALIAPCGQEDAVITSISAYLQPPPSLNEVGLRFVAAFAQEFGLRPLVVRSVDSIGVPRNG